MNKDAKAARRALLRVAGSFLAGLALMGCLAGCAASKVGGTGQDGAEHGGPAITKLSDDANNEGMDGSAGTGASAGPAAGTQPGAQAPSDDGTATDSAVQAVAVVHTELHETAQTHTVKSPRLAQQIYEAYLHGVAGEVTDVWATDYDDILTFTLSDGSTVTAEFNAHNLRDGDVYREFDDRGGLWGMLAEMDG